MSQPILTVSSSATQQRKAQVNLLPCRVHHDGSLNSIETYWNPTEDADNTKTAYIRGRKLHGKTVKLPSGYYGSVAEKGETKREMPASDAIDNTSELEELPEPMEIAPLSSKAQFDDLVIWGHESSADSATDPYLRSMEEWISFSEQIHSYSASMADSK
ncbi:ribonuclease H2, subunit C [Pestalotiopsis sp. NC0098]|nr:ribonuclease H2, subunit C [Pestalotiopsis sp. NC0098]